MFPLVLEGHPRLGGPLLSVRSNLALGLNASQDQNCGDDNDKENSQFHLASISFDVSEARVPKHIIDHELGMDRDEDLASHREW